MSDFEAAFGLEPDIANSMPDPTGRVIDGDDADALIDAFEHSKQIADAWYAFNRRLRERLFEMSDGDKKTRRVRGRRRRCTVTQPSDGWDQSILKEAFNSYPHLRDEFLSIASLRVRLREFRKAENETGPPDFEQFRAMLLNANRGPQGSPTVKIEE